MHTRRPILIAAVLALLVIIAVVNHRWSQKPASVAATAPVVAPKAAGPIVSSPKLPVIQPISADSQPAGSDFTRAPIDIRWGHSQQSLDFIVALKDQQYLGLSKEQMEKLLTAYLEIGIERSIYEGSIATVKAVSPTESVITIPPYPEAGLKLQDELYQKFAEVLGKERGAEVQAAMGPTLYARNYGFGDTEQQIRVRLLEGKPATYSFVHSTGTLRVPYKDSYMTVKYGGMGSTHTLDDLNAYIGFIDLLPGGGS